MKVKLPDWFDVPTIIRIRTTDQVNAMVGAGAMSVNQARDYYERVMAKWTR